MLVSNRPAQITAPEARPRNNRAWHKGISAHTHLPFKKNCWSDHREGLSEDLAFNIPAAHNKVPASLIRNAYTLFSWSTHRACLSEELATGWKVCLSSKVAFQVSNGSNTGFPNLWKPDMLPCSTSTPTNQLPGPKTITLGERSSWKG
jgi:hypothetical protein